MFYNGDIVMFNDLRIKKINFIHKFYVSLFGGPNENNYVHSFSDNAKYKYDLKNGDIYQVDMYFLGWMSITPLNVNIGNIIYWTTSIKNFRVVPKVEYTKILRKEKLKKIQDG